MTAKGARKKAVQPSPKRASAARKQWNALAPTGDFAAFVARVVAIIENARSRVVRTVNSEMVLSYWHIGREIVEYVQRGEARAEYGEQVLEDLSAQLLARVGRGYSTRNLWHFRDFYLTYRERSPSIRAEEFRTSLVQNPKPIDAAKILREAGAEFAWGFSSHLARGPASDLRRRRPTPRRDLHDVRAGRAFRVRVPMGLGFTVSLERRQDALATAATHTDAPVFAGFSRDGQRPRVAEMVSEAQP